MTPVAVSWRGRLVRRLADYLALTKPGVVVMVLVTTAVGYYLGSAAPSALLPLLRHLAGTALAAAGTLALNQWMERDLDARMARTRHRPLPGGRILPAEAFALGAALLAAGLAVLALAVNGLTAALTGAIALVYLLVYTPLKPVTPLSMIAGAISVPVLDQGGGSTSLQAFNNCLALLPVGLLPTLIGLTGSVYLVLSTVLALGFLWTAARFVQDRSAPAARRLLMASLVYLPALLAVMAFDRQGH